MTAPEPPDASEPAPPGTRRRALGCLLIGLAFFPGAFCGFSVVHGHESWDWPPVTATVTGHTLTSECGGFGVRLKYRYEVAGRLYTADQAMSGRASMSFAMRDSAEQFIAAHPNGTTVAAYHHPADPYQAVLHKGLWPWTTTALAATGGLALGGYLLIRAGRRARSPESHAPGDERSTLL
ncbi:MAG TPA: DUF3592 domain-containing protein [Tepidisphaeraceae bacterium]|nr:DUF3592 domain-containing protein [Tepidisphaeraceae bacterium]